MQRQSVLRPRQQRAIIALTTQPDLTRAAAAVGVAPSTLWRWLQQPTFRQAYNEARRGVVASAVARLQQLTGKAAATLEAVMDSRAKASSKVTAARIVLEMALRAGELEDLRHEVEDLKRRAARSGGVAEGRPLRVG